MAPQDLNAGILDFSLGEQWVHQNIAAFGGDPNHIVGAGQSYGASMLEVEQIYVPAAKISRKASIQMSTTGPM
jgi:para-nitrobenzyl esterase